MVLIRAASRQSHRETPSDGSCGFFRLPREIRDQIYSEAVPQDKRLYLDPLKRKNLGGCLKNSKNAARHVLAAQTGLNLLLTSRTLAIEVSPVLYGRNCFVFACWERAIDWLKLIGERNRRHLTTLKMPMRKPPRVWQLEDGTVEGDCYSMEFLNAYPRHSRHPLLMAHPRHPLLMRPVEAPFPIPEGTWPVGMIESIDPKMEELFSLLGKIQDAPKIVITLTHAPPMIPGIPPPRSAHHCYDWCPHYSMDLPNLIEAWRHANGSDADPEHREMCVEWSYFTRVEDRETMLAQLRATSWNVRHVYTAAGKRTERVVVMMEKHQGPIVAALPSCPGNERPAVRAALQGLYGLTEDIILAHTSMVGWVQAPTKEEKDAWLREHSKRG